MAIRTLRNIQTASLHRMTKCKLYTGMFIYSNRTVIFRTYYTSVILYYVTGFWKTDQNITLDLFHFIGPANAYTHTLSIHSAITRLSYCTKEPPNPKCVEILQP